MNRFTPFLGMDAQRVRGAAAMCRDLSGAHANVNALADLERIADAIDACSTSMIDGIEEGINETLRTLGWFPDTIGSVVIRDAAIHEAVLLHLRRAAHVAGRPMPETF